MRTKLVVVGSWLAVILGWGLLIGTVVYYVHFREPEEAAKQTPGLEYKHFERTADGKPICPKCGHSDEVGQCFYPCGGSPNNPEYHCGHCQTGFGESSQYKRMYEQTR